MSFGVGYSAAGDGLFTFSGRRVLLLQGPHGPFFRRLARDLRWTGASVHKVNFTGGDWLFDPGESTNFRQPLDRWPEFLSNLIRERRIDAIMLYGDCRPVHRIAAGIAKTFGIELFVFEEGYVRPDYVTLERSGVNGHSTSPRNAIFYLNRPIDLIEEPAAVPPAFWHAAWWAFLYYNACVFLRPWFRHHNHHRRTTLGDGFAWLVSLGRKIYYERVERRALPELTREGAPSFYLVPLQVFNDAQVTVHSDEGSVVDFIRAVARSFVEHAPADSRLVFKHHPMDRGYVDYTRLIRRVARDAGLDGRVWYIHDQHLPSLLNHAAGLVTINSTVGMSSLLHEVPTITLGTAYYDIAGLTFQFGLDRFWTGARREDINLELYRAFRAFLVKHTQVNGSFSRRLPGVRVASGLNWSSSGPRPIAPPALGATERKAG